MKYLQKVLITLALLIFVSSCMNNTTEDATESSALFIGETAEPGDAVCMNGYCEHGETREICPWDCEDCGDYHCGAGENCNNCIVDCGRCPPPTSTVNSGAENIYQTGATLSEQPTWDEYGPFGGSFRISERGTATYSIPIQTAPGTAGLAPQVGLNYDSQGRNGLVGVGWSVSGQSSISRCRPSKETDGFDGKIQFATDDRFCLDGQRLILVDGERGALDSTYRTEIDALILVTLVRVAPDGQPLGFKIEGKDGDIRYYGDFNGDNPTAVVELNETRADSYGIASYSVSGNYLSWSLSEIEDAAGNYIRYEYQNDVLEGTHLLTRVWYTGHHLGSGSTWVIDSEHDFFAHLDFVYETRDDQRTSYSMGHRSLMKHRLARIESWSEGNLLLEYLLTYATPRGNVPARLEHIQQCGGSAEVCLPPLSMEWLYPQRVEFEVSSSTRRRSCLSLLPTNFDNDGQQDFACLYNRGGREEPHDYYYISAEKTAVEDDLQEVRIYKNKIESWTLTDYNGDSKQDILYLGENSPNWFVKVTDGGDVDTGVGAVQDLPYPGGYHFPIHPSFSDFDGNGLPDLFFLDKDRQPKVALLKRPGSDHTCANNDVNIDAFTPFCFGQSITATGDQGDSSPDWSEMDRDDNTTIDLNGDGFADILAVVKRAHAGANYWRVRALVTEWSPSGELVFKDDLVMSRTLEDINIQSHMRYLYDFNGDGLTDILYSNHHCQDYDQCTWKVKINTGLEFVRHFTDLGKTYSEGMASDIVISDVTTDGLPDILMPEVDEDGNGRGFRVYSRTNDESFRRTAEELWIGTYHKNNQYLAVDVDGDGSQELMGVWDDGYPHTQNYTTYSINTAFTPLAVAAIEDVNGARTELSYRPLTGDVHSSDGTGPSQVAGRGSPIFDLVYPGYVVSGARSSAPTAGEAPFSVDESEMKEVRYRYANMRMQAGGRGLLGFERLYTLDPDTHVETVTAYAQQFPHTGMALRTEQRYLGVPAIAGPSSTPLDRWGLYHDETPLLMSRAVNTPNKKVTALGGWMPFVEKAEESTWDLEGRLLSTLEIVREYDNYGNAIRVTTRNGTAQEGVVQKEETVVNDFGSPTDTRYGRLQRATSTLTRRHANGSQESVQRTSSFVYDPHTRFLTESIVEPEGDISEYLKTVYRRDIYGNVTAKIQCSANVPSCGYTMAYPDALGLGFNRWAINDYDPKGRFVERTRNVYNQVLSEVTARNQLYQPTITIDASGNETQHFYTFNGRKTATLSPTGVMTETSLDQCGDAHWCPPGVGAATVTSTTSVSNDGEALQLAPTQWVVHDKLGREVAAFSDRFGGGSHRPTVVTEYDIYSRVKRKSSPFFYDEDNPTWSKSDYDVLGRLVWAEAPDGAQSTITYNGLEVTFTNDLNQVKIQEKNTLGELVAVTDNRGNTITYDYSVGGSLKTLYRTNGEPQTLNTYDRLGRKAFMWDADKSPGDPTETGWSYYHNALGEMVGSEDPRGYETVSYRDGVGRLVRRVERDDGGSPLTDVSYSYQNTVSQGKESGKLLAEEEAISGNRKQYFYDGPGGRLSEVRHELGSETFTETTDHDEFGRVSVVRDATGHGLLNKYSATGYLFAVADADNPGYEFQRINAMDAHGNVTEETAANGVVTTREYNLVTGRLEGIESNRQSENIQRMSYGWDTLGNLEYRHDTTAGRDLFERFYNDDMNRLDHVTDEQGTVTLDLEYSNEGNIDYKSDVGDMSYSETTCDGVQAGPHAVTGADGKSYCYDENGNQVSGNERELEYNNTYDLPTTIRATDDSHVTHFKYGPNKQRYRRIDHRPDEGTTTTTYIGNVERIQRADGATVWRRHLPGAVETDDEVRFVHRDHLGSSSTLTDENGQVVQRYSFDAFGKQRDTQNWETYWNDWLDQPSAMSPLSPRSDYTSRGFTGHEHIDELGLIHMNGRVYDPHLGRFLQADPFIQDRTLSQNINRYSYVLNNPLAYTDPSGFFFSKIRDFFKDNWKMIAVIAIGVAAPYLIPGLSPFLLGAITGAVSGYIMTGTLKGAVLGAFSGAAFGALHQIKAGSIALKFGKGMAHGAAGGVMSVMQGGKFMHGFLSAGLSQSFELAGVYKAMGVTTARGIGNRIKNAAVSAALGGTVSQLSGGKFVNGAITSAYSRLLNDLGELANHEGYVTQEGDQPPPAPETADNEMLLQLVVTPDIETSIETAQNAANAADSAVEYAAGKVPGITPTGTIISILSKNFGLELRPYDRLDMVFVYDKKHLLSWLTGTNTSTWEMKSLTHHQALKHGYRTRTFAAYGRPFGQAPLNRNTRQMCINYFYMVTSRRDRQR